MKYLLIIILLLIPIQLQTQSKYEIDCPPDLVFHSMNILTNLVGIREKTNKNDGYIINQIQYSCGLKNGDPYCQATQYYTFQKAVELLNMNNLTCYKNPIPRNGLAQSTFNKARKTGKKTKYFCQIGDLVVWKKGKTAYGHIERIDKLGKNGWIVTIGGNVSNGNQQGIFRKKRNLALPLNRVLTIKGIVGFKNNPL